MSRTAANVIDPSPSHAAHSKENVLFVRDITIVMRNERVATLRRVETAYERVMTTLLSSENRHRVPRRGRRYRRNVRPAFASTTRTTACVTFTTTVSTFVFRSVKRTTRAWPATFDAGKNWWKKTTTITLPCAKWNRTPLLLPPNAHTPKHYNTNGKTTGRLVGRRFDLQNVIAPFKTFRKFKTRQSNITNTRTVRVGSWTFESIGKIVFIFKITSINLMNALKL